MHTARYKHSTPIHSWVHCSFIHTDNIITLIAHIIAELFPICYHSYSDSSSVAYTLLFAIVSCNRSNRTHLFIHLISHSVQSSQILDIAIPLFVRAFKSFTCGHSFCRSLFAIYSFIKSRRSSSSVE